MNGESRGKAAVEKSLEVCKAVWEISCVLGYWMKAPE